MKQYATIIGIAVVIGIMAWVVVARTAKAPENTDCVVEAKICPDGSAVRRVAPKCDFAECPVAVATTTTDGGGGGVLPNNSGVRGTVSLGPTCPVQRIPPDPACADKPYAAAVIAVRRAGSSSIFATMNSDANGAFKISLPPGSYTLTAGAGRMFPRCSPADVTVDKGAYATITISCDTGIR